jgi:hypothetical protein
MKPREHPEMGRNPSIAGSKQVEREVRRDHSIKLRSAAIEHAGLPVVKPLHIAAVESVSLGSHDVARRHGLVPR